MVRPDRNCVVSAARRARDALAGVAPAMQKPVRADGASVGPSGAHAEVGADGGAALPEGVVAPAMQRSAGVDGATVRVARAERGVFRQGHIRLSSGVVAPTGDG